MPWGHPQIAGKFEKLVVDLRCTCRMSNNRDSSENLSACDGTIHIGNNEIIRSCRTGNVRKVTVVNVEKINVTLYDVLYVLNKMYDFIAVTQVRWHTCLMVVDNVGDDSGRGNLMIKNKELQQVKMVLDETDKALYRVFITVRHSEEAQLTRHGGTYIWDKLLGHCSDEILKLTLEHARRINKKYLRSHETIHCDTYALAS